MKMEKDTEMKISIYLLTSNTQSMIGFGYYVVAVIQIGITVKEYKKLEMKPLSK